MPIDLGSIERVMPRGKVFSIYSRPFWHLEHEDGLILHNAKLGEGLVLSPGLISPQTVTPYQILHHDRLKEQVWEEVRRTSFGTAPSRLGSTYLLPERTQVDSAQNEMFAGQQRRLLEARILEGSAIHIGDMALLDVPPADYELNARLYWSGHMTAAPRPEALVLGGLYFPEWESFPILGSRPVDGAGSR